ncbi:hypothetical protein [Streptomyces bauhiniae]|uniref:hypothetical protein n=1 Tax=Streptomyces bauhiniae TaxID=2340725 RepID=UPI0035E27645
MSSRKSGKFMLSGALSAAVLGAVMAGSGVAVADDGNGYVNTYITTYSSDSLCVKTKDGLNKAHGYPKDNEYYYCGGSGHNVLWFRHRA